MEASAQLVRMDVERQAGDCTKGARACVRGGAHRAKGGPSRSDSNGPVHGKTLRRQDEARAQLRRAAYRKVVMEQRVLGRTGRQVSVVGLGTWQLGADWGHLSRDDALAVLRAAADAGVRFVRTADVYGGGRSEQFIGEFLRERGDTGPPITVATKMTRTTKSSPYRTSRYTGRPWRRRRERSTRVGLMDAHTWVKCSSSTSRAMLASSGERTPPTVLAIGACFAIRVGVGLP